MTVPKLDERLLIAAGYVRFGTVAADIGCDHGKLSANLAASGKVKKVIAVDVRRHPLSKAEKLFKSLSLDGICECRLGDGLSVLKKDEAQDIIIAGMSGVTIAQILTDPNADINKEQQFILVPTCKPDHLRRALYNNGFYIIDETAAEAAEKFYTVICAGYDGEKKEPDEYFCLLGKIAGRCDSASAGVIEKTRKQLEKELTGRKNDLRYTKEQNDLLKELLEKIKNNETAYEEL